MITSMTGFGQAELKLERGAIRVEIKTVNHKYSEISVRLPLHLVDLEEVVRRRAVKDLKRGKATVFVSAPDPAAYSARLILNEPLAKEMYSKLLKLRRALSLSVDDRARSEIFSEIARHPNVLTADTSASEGRQELARAVERAVGKALDDLRASRQREGRALLQDLQSRIAEIRKAVRTIESRLPATEREFRRTLEKKVKAVTGENGFDRERLSIEAAQYVKSSDISEEVTRMKAHLAEIERTLQQGGEAGRKIDFIAQEMTREANTMGAKSSDVATANAVIRIKSTIEKIREQAQNVE